MTDESVRIALLGFPQTGKTTYLAAFYNALCDEEVVSPLKASALPAQATYLMTILRNWQDALPTARTPTIEQSHVELLLSHDERVFTLTMPDMSGELFQQLLRERTAQSPVYETLVGYATYLVFVHPDELRERVLLTDIQAAQESVAAVVGRSPTVDTAAVRDFEVDRLPLQSTMVDLLQCMDELRSGSAFRLALVISAWDRVDHSAGSPERWLTDRMPLLSQYLRNARHIRHAVFGVSAQGGAYDAAGSLAHVPYADRAYTIVARTAERHDITAPVLWAAGLAEGLG